MKRIHRIAIPERALLAAILLLAGVLLFIGWRMFWFFTDDAYIAFRYVSNSRLSYGYVWNAPPFLPVEGYTSFLWVLLLDGVWRIIGIEPPVSANWAALVFSYGTFLIASGMVFASSIWQGQQPRSRVILVGLLALFLGLNRTFLAWSSSGLETAMFDFLLVMWVSVSLSSLAPPRRACLAALVATATALTRPDGLLYCAFTGILVLLLVLGEPDRRRAVRTLVCGFLPFAIVLAHLVWRVSFYGAWFPNTYYAKVVSAWPQSGLRYGLSFVLEYALWLPITVIAWALFRSGSTGWLRFRTSTARENFLSALGDTAARVGPSFAVVGALLLDLGYYTLMVGGDHFEYRVYAHSVPLVFVALVWALAKLQLRWHSALAIVLAFLVLSLPVQWTHWLLTKDLSTRAETLMMRVPIAPHWPKAVRWYANVFDKMQSWLIYHHVCMRHQEHKVFWQWQSNAWPSREEGMKLSGDGYPVVALPCVGVPSWTLPHVNIIDTFGLNDYVIARTSVPAGSERLMAHSRQPPQGYVESYQPNLFFSNGSLDVADRPEPLTRSRIAGIERYWRNRIITIEQGAEGDAAD